MHPSLVEARRRRRFQRPIEVRHSAGEIAQAAPNDPSELVEIHHRYVRRRQGELRAERFGDVQMLASFDEC